MRRLSSASRASAVLIGAQSSQRGSPQGWREYSQYWTAPASRPSAMSQRSASLSLPARRLPRSTALAKAESKVSVASSITTSFIGGLLYLVAVSAITAGLQGEQLSIMPPHRHELGVTAPLDNTPVIEHHAMVGHAHGGKPMRDQDGDAALRQGAKVLKDLRFGTRIHRRRRLIQHQYI